MKLNLLFIFTLLLNQPVISQTPNYFDNSPAWYGQEYVGPMIADDLTGWTDDVLYYSSDLSIELGDFSYIIIEKRIFRTPAFGGGGPESTFEVENDYSFYVRQEDRSIYTYIDGQDSLLMSFDLSVGDYFHGHFGALNPDKFVRRIDSVLIGDTYRRKFFTDTTGDTFPESHVLEGVGYFGYDTDGGIGYFIGNPEHYGEFWELDFSYHIYCYGEENSALWPTDEESPCLLTLNIAENKNSKSNIELYPNPASTILSINSTEILSQISILGIDGGKILTSILNSSSSNINISNLPSGVYVVEINYQNGEISHEKIIIK